MATFLSLQCKVRGLSFLSADRVAASAVVTDVIDFLGGRFVQADVLADSMEVQVLGDLPRPILVFCDNGNKPLEFARYITSLTDGDFIAVHDWGTEFLETNIVGTVEFFMKEECEAVDSMTRFFRVVQA